MKTTSDNSLQPLRFVPRALYLIHVVPLTLYDAFRSCFLRVHFVLFASSLIVPACMMCVDPSCALTALLSKWLSKVDMVTFN